MTQISLNIYSFSYASGVQLIHSSIYSSVIYWNRELVHWPVQFTTSFGGNWRKCYNVNHFHCELIKFMQYHQSINQTLQSIKHTIIIFKKFLHLVHRLSPCNFIQVYLLVPYLQESKFSQDNLSRQFYVAFESNSLSISI